MDKRFALCMICILLIKSLYADPDPLFKIQPPEQVVSQGASGEIQTATMDQNGRWHAPKPKEGSHSSHSESTLSSINPEGLSGKCGRR